jgi:hypothetical protein
VAGRTATVEIPGQKMVGDSAVRIGASRQGQIGAPHRARLAPAAAPRGHRSAVVRRGAQQARRATGGRAPQV